MKLRYIALILLYCSSLFSLDPAEHFFEKMKNMEQKYHQLSESHKENVKKAIIELAEYFDNLEGLVKSTEKINKIYPDSARAYVKFRIGQILEQNKARELMCNFGKAVSPENSVNPISCTCEQMYELITHLRTINEQMQKE